MRHYPRVTRLLARKNILKPDEVVFYVMKNRGFRKTRLILTNYRVFIMRRIGRNQTTENPVVERIIGFRRRAELLVFPIDQILSLKIINTPSGEDLEIRTASAGVIIERVPSKKAFRAINILESLKNGQFPSGMDQNETNERINQFQPIKHSKLIYCAKCGTENDVGSNYCKNCGSSMEM